MKSKKKHNNNLHYITNLKRYGVFSIAFKNKAEIYFQQATNKLNKTNTAHCSSKWPTII